MGIETVISGEGFQRGLPADVTPGLAPPSAGNSGYRKRSRLGLIVKGGLFLMLAGGVKHAVEYMVTDYQIYTVKVGEGNTKSIEYAFRLWREIHPTGQETFMGNALHSGKRKAILEYLGYRNMEGSQQREKK